MKHPVLFKTLALLLCALSLFASVAAAAGVVVLAEGNLYNKTVDQMLSDRIRSDGTAYASFLAQEYASEYLGGVPSQLVNGQFGHSNWFYRSYDQAHYGYAILDAQGQEIYGYNVELRDAADIAFRESFPITGNYMHLVSLESQEEIQNALRQSREEIYSIEPTLTLQDNLIPAQGTVVSYAVFTDDTGELILDAFYNGSATVVTSYHSDGSSESYYEESQVGLLLFDQTRHLVFHSFFAFPEELGDLAVEEAVFRSDDGLSLRLRAEEGAIGTLYRSDSGNLRFLSSQAAAIPEETLPEETVPEETVPPTVPETVPPTVPETTPPETWVEETWAEETWVEEENWEESSASAVPEEGASETVPPTEAPTVPPTEETVPVTEETLPPATEPEMLNGKPLMEYQLNAAEYWDASTGQTMQARFVYLPMPELTVELYLEEEALRYAPLYDVLRMVRPYRNYLLPAAACFALLFVLLGIYLVIAAARSPRQEGLRAGGLNRLPLDLYFVIDTGLIGGLLCVPILAANLLLKTDFLLFCGLTAGAVFLACLVFVGFCFAWAAQWKTHIVWKNSFCARFLSWLVLAAVALEKFLSVKLLPVLWRILKKLGSIALRVWRWVLGKLRAVLGALRAVLGALMQCIQRFLKLLPLTWQWFLGGSFVIFVTLIVSSLDGVGLLLGILLCFGLIGYGAYSFGILADSTRRMSKGDLETKVDDKHLFGCFKDSAVDLNALADVAVVAAQKQLKSERMKTELITNVSHDIKTPLTSIINYVDLLQKPHTDEEQAEYLEVLDRQSQRLKKLIDDLMDMSKASTGNMAVEITQLDAVESVNQALGEFADKLEKAQLIPVFRHSVDAAPILADGKLVWRVLSNLLGNAVKYAMPGTRLYLDLQLLEDKVILSLKNISREELNINADELMERFVRGDDSRNTEGSGLGLNIAKSLMELQKGQLHLLVDGDLFKVTLTFPCAQ